MESNIGQPPSSILASCCGANKSLMSSFASMEFKNAHDLAYIPVELEVMLNDCLKAVGNDDSVDLDIYSVYAIAPKVLHSEMLLDEFEDVMT